MGVGGLYAPLDAQHRTDFAADHIRIRPAWLRITLIRLVLLGFGGVVTAACVYNLRYVGLHWMAIFLVIALGLGLIMLAGAVLPWKTLWADIDARGLRLKGHGAARAGHIAWSEVERVILYERSKDGLNTVGILLRDGLQVGIQRTNGLGRAYELADALERIGGITTPRRTSPPVADAPDLDLWPPAAPAGHPHHAEVQVERLPEGTAIGPRRAARATARRYIAYGLVAGLLAVGAAGTVLHVWGIMIPNYSCEYPCTGFGEAVLHTILFVVAGGLFFAAYHLVRAGVHLRAGPHLHLVTSDQLIVLDGDRQVRQRFRLADIKTLAAGGHTICIDLKDDKTEKLHFEGLRAPDDLYWALRALEHELGAVGWQPTGPRQDRTAFEKEHGWRITASVRTGGRSGPDLDIDGPGH